MDETNDPFAGGIQCAADRILRINALGEADVLRVLDRTDIQASVRRHALDRLRRLRATKLHQNWIDGITPNKRIA